MRSLNGSIFSLKSQNKWLWVSMIGSLAATTLVIYVPFLRDAFEFAHISLFEYFIAIAMAFAIIPIVELAKLIQRTVGLPKAFGFRQPFYLSSQRRRRIYALFTHPELGYDIIKIQ